MDKNNIDYSEMDKECVDICKSINRISGLETTSSCCGHNKKEFRIWIKVNDLDKLSILLYYLDSCHVGFNWYCTVTTDCAMSPPHFCIESHSMGDESYKESKIISLELNNYLDKI